MASLEAASTPATKETAMRNMTEYVAPSGPSSLRADTDAPSVSDPKSGCRCGGEGGRAFGFGRCDAAADGSPKAPLDAAVGDLATDFGAPASSTMLALRVGVVSGGLVTRRDAPVSITCENGPWKP